MSCHKNTWKGRSKHGGGYILITVVPGRKGRKELEHRVIMEQVLGRKLKPGEVVHHKNHDRKDNRPENLELCASAGIHNRDHHRSPKFTFEGRHHNPQANQFSGKNKGDSNAKRKETKASIRGEGSNDSPGGSD